MAGLGLDLPIVIVIGLVMAAAGLLWLWREQSRPSLVDRQERTIGRMQDRTDHLQEDMDELRREFDEFRRATRDAQDGYEEELTELRNFIDEQWRGWQLILEQMKAAQLVPVWQPKPPPAKRKRKPATDAPSSALAEKIARQFNIEEMNSLAFDIGVLPEEFSGATREARARELVELCHRRGITIALEARRKELRPE